MAYVRKTVKATTEHTVACDKCGKTFVSSEKDEGLCWDCKHKVEQEKLKTKLPFFIGAKVIDFDCSSIDNLNEIILKTKEGRKIRLKAGGYGDGRYIEYEFIEEKSQNEYRRTEVES